MIENNGREKRNPNLPDWFRLDNAASIFPGQNRGSWSNIFRFCIELKENIDPEKLTRALENIMPRFPGFDVRIRKGFFGITLKRIRTLHPMLSRTFKTPVTE